MAQSQYRLLKRKHINDEKWNACIDRNSELPYALTWYLDCVAENWSALVLRDYEAVFPIVWKKKFAITVVYNPFFCQQLGVFTDNDHPMFDATCLRFLQRKFLYSDVNLHYNSIAESSKLFSIRQNFVLPLNQEYEKIKEGYSKNTQRNLTKTKLHHVYTAPFTDAYLFAGYYEKYSAVGIKGYARKHTIALEQLIKESVKRGMGKMVAAYSVEGNPPVALAFFLRYKNRIFNLAPITFKESRETGAMSFILDELIREHSNSDVVLDFEGSSVESIGRFYRGFGAKSQNFWNYHHTLFDTFLQPLKGQTYLL